MYFYILAEVTSSTVFFYILAEIFVCIFIFWQRSHLRLYFFTFWQRSIDCILYTLAEITSWTVFFYILAEIFDCILLHRSGDHIFDWSLGRAVPRAEGPFTPRPSMGSRFFFFWSSPGSPSGFFAMRHSTGSFPPGHVFSLNSLHSSHTGTCVGSSVGKWSFQSSGSIFPCSMNRWICRAVYFMHSTWVVFPL